MGGFFKNMGVGAVAEKKDVVKWFMNYTDLGDESRIIVLDDLSVNINLLEYDKSLKFGRDVEEIPYKINSCRGMSFHSNVKLENLPVYCDYLNIEDNDILEDLIGLPKFVGELRVRRCKNFKSMAGAGDIREICINYCSNLEYGKYPTSCTSFETNGYHKMHIPDECRNRIHFTEFQPDVKWPREPISLEDIRNQVAVGMCNVDGLWAGESGMFDLNPCGELNINFNTGPDQ